MSKVTTETDGSAVSLLPTTESLNSNLWLPSQVWHHHILSRVSYSEVAFFSRSCRYAYAVALNTIQKKMVARFDRLDATLALLLRRQAKQKSIMVVGHNPTLSEFLSLLVSDEAVASTIELKKGAVAKVELKKRPVLEWILTPKTVALAQEASATSSRPKTSRK